MRASPEIETLCVGFVEWSFSADISYVSTFPTAGYTRLHMLHMDIQRAIANVYQCSELCLKAKS